jgi:lysine/ornithine N-monooxygenase
MSTESRYVVWHQRDNDGLVKAVFASPDRLLYAHMMRHAQYLVHLANDGIMTTIEEQGDGVMKVEYREPKTGETEQDVLVVGTPDQPFEELLLTEQDRLAVASVQEHFGGWSSVPDEFVAELAEEPSDET